MTHNPITGTTVTPQYQNILSADQSAANQTQIQIERMRQQAEAQRQALANQSDVYRADRESDTSLQLGSMSNDVTRRGQDTSLLQALESYASNERQLGVRDATERRSQDVGERVSTRGQDLDFRAAMAPVEWQRERFNQVLPLFTGVMRDFGTFEGGGQPSGTMGTEMYSALGGQASGTSRGLGGSNLPAPEITVGGVFSPEQTQQQLNAGYARNAMMADTQRRRIGESAGGRGMSGSSPLLSALSSGVGAAQMATDAETARETKLGHSKANAEQRLASEGLRSQQWSQANQGDIARRQLVQQQQNALVMALAGMM